MLPLNGKHEVQPEYDQLNDGDETNRSDDPPGVRLTEPPRNRLFLRSVVHDDDIPLDLKIEEKSRNRKIFAFQDC